MIKWALAGSALLTLSALLTARYAPAPYWIYGLAGIGAGVALIAVFVLRLAMDRKRPALALSWVALSSAIAAVSSRYALMATLHADPAQALHLSFGRLFLVGASLAWAAIALIWGTHALVTAFDPPRRSDRVKRARTQLTLGAAALCLSLYGLAPIWMLLGLRIDYRTLVGLCALGLGAYLINLIYLRLLRR
ncbi:MAG: hypothetical protein H6707_08335 [Deltaproteobacteria bacterium]|nr:hypothetical protein [Deltaproteobacteria bacterium]